MEFIRRLQDKRISTRTKFENCIKIFLCTFIIIYLYWLQEPDIYQIYIDTDDGSDFKTDPKIIFTTKAPERYYVDTSHCRIPYLNPFESQIQETYIRSEYTKCSTDQTLISTAFNINSQQYTLHINEDAVIKFTNASDDLICCYHKLFRPNVSKTPDYGFIYTSCKVFGQDYAVPTNVEFILIKCKLKSTNQTIQEDAFAFIQTKGKVNTSKKRKPSVLLIGIDSLSRMNFRRVMPKTIQYLERNQWFEMEGYNKVADNTFPNLMAVLTGLDQKLSHSKCPPEKIHGLDKCNFIWDDYKQSGYYTAYAEDVASLSTFNYLKVGFSKQPTDYYLRPLMLAIEKKLKISQIAGLPYCVGRRQYGEYIYDYGLEFATRFSNENIFGLFWTNSFSHNKYDTTSKMDMKIMKYLKQFQLSGIFEESIVFFFSDHGRRWGRLVEMPEGFLEERLPMFYISLPPWFKTQHPNFVKALEINKNRLTSPYDVHMTLKHILELYEPDKKFSPALSCGKCKSLFFEIPENRTCDDAGIMDAWCACAPYERISHKNKKVKRITELIIKDMNYWLIEKKLSSMCSKIELLEIKDAFIKVEEKMFKVQTESTYRIKFITSPKSAKFQATAIYNYESDSIRIAVDQISRLNSYHNYSKCVHDSAAKKYCMCKGTTDNLSDDSWKRSLGIIDISSSILDN